MRYSIVSILIMGSWRRNLHEHLECESINFRLCFDLLFIWKLISIEKKKCFKTKKNFPVQAHPKWVTSAFDYLLLCVSHTDTCPMQIGINYLQKFDPFFWRHPLWRLFHDFTELELEKNKSLVQFSQQLDTAFVYIKQLFTYIPKSISPFNIKPFLSH